MLCNSFLGGADTPPGERRRHQTVTKIKQTLAKAPLNPVLFVSDPTNGDRFEFGTAEELENERQALEEAGIAVQISTAQELLNTLDFEVYEGNEPEIRR